MPDREVVPDEDYVPAPVGEGEELVTCADCQTVSPAGGASECPACGASAVPRRRGGPEYGFGVRARRGGRSLQGPRVSPPVLATASTAPGDATTTIMRPFVEANGSELIVRPEAVVRPERWRTPDHPLDVLQAFDSSEQVWVNARQFWRSVLGVKCGVRRVTVSFRLRQAELVRRQTVTLDKIRIGQPPKGVDAR
jgi:hypothetical protein